MHVIDRRASAGRAVYARKLLFTKENMIYIGKYYYLLPWRCPRTPRPHARGLRVESALWEGYPASTLAHGVCVIVYV